MTIKLASEHDLLDWPEYGITMSRAQAERLVAEGIALPLGEPHEYPEGCGTAPVSAMPFYSVLVQRMDFHHRSKPSADESLEATE